VAVVIGVVAAVDATDGDANVAEGASPSFDGDEAAGAVRVVLGARGMVDAGMVDVDGRPAASIC
jgi:hypothetical protein